MNSLDPRVKRLPKTGQPGEILPKAALDQFGTFEVFVQPKAGKPFQHEGFLVQIFFIKIVNQIHAVALLIIPHAGNCRTLNN